MFVIKNFICQILNDIFFKENHYENNIKWSEWNLIKILRFLIEEITIKSELQ
jgi:hypothetical protein